MDFPQRIGQRLKQARLAKGMTQPELGAKLALSKTNLSHWENGVHMPDLEQFTGLCDATEVSADWVLGRALTELSAEALAEARAYDALSPEDRRKWRALRMTMFTPA